MVTDFIQTYKLFSAANLVGNHLVFGTILNGVVISDVNGNIVVGKLMRQGNTTEYVIYAERNLLKSKNSDSAAPINSSPSAQTLNREKRFSPLGSP